MCATFGQDCVRAEEYSDNLCGAAFVQSYSCDDDYAAIQLRSGHSLGHTFCTCTSGDSSATGGPTWLWFGGSEDAAQSASQVCRKFCEAASEKGKLALKHVQGLTCYCKRK